MYLFFNDMATVFSIKKLLTSKHTTLRSAIVSVDPKKKKKRSTVVSSAAPGSGQHFSSPPQLTFPSTPPRYGHLLRPHMDYL